MRWLCSVCRRTSRFHSSERSCHGCGEGAARVVQSGVQNGVQSGARRRALRRTLELSCSSDASCVSSCATASACCTAACSALCLAASSTVMLPVSSSRFAAISARACSRPRRFSIRPWRCSSISSARAICAERSLLAASRLLRMSDTNEALSPSSSIMPLACSSSLRCVVVHWAKSSCSRSCSIRRRSPRAFSSFARATPLVSIALAMLLLSRCSSSRSWFILATSPAKRSNVRSTAAAPATSNAMNGNGPVIVAVSAESDTRTERKASVHRGAKQRGGTRKKTTTL